MIAGYNNNERYSSQSIEYLHFYLLNEFDTGMRAGNRSVNIHSGPLKT